MMLPNAPELNLVPFNLELLGDCLRDNLRVAIVGVVDDCSSPDSSPRFCR
jgi:hypothetical protein